MNHSVKLLQLVLSAILYMGGYSVSTAQTIVYVNANASGSNNGTSWADAYAELSQALTVANNPWGSNMEIRVAAGTYYPTGQQSGTNRATLFSINRGGIKLYGGYNATTGIRNINANTTILSGDIGILNNVADNSHHVLSLVGISSGQDSVIVDGFQIEKGNSNDNFSSISVNGYSLNASEGGGIITSNNTADNILFNNCIIRNNNASSYGAGIANISARPNITNCKFIDNELTYPNSNFGGGISNKASSVNIANCIFVQNDGGAVYNFNGTSSIVNCVFANNNSSDGGGVNNHFANTQIINCTFAGNSGTGGAVIYNIYSATTVVINSILWGNTSMPLSGSGITVINSDIQGGYAGTNNMDVDPLFINVNDPDGADNIPGTADDGLNILNISYAVNAGDNTFVPGAVATDVMGGARIQHSTVDMGAYETATLGTSLYVDANGVSNGSGVSWASPLKYLSDALKINKAKRYVNNIYVAKGSYYPTGNKSSNLRDSTFLITNGNLKIYGGYDAATGVRNVAANPTILSGDINTASDIDNSFHIMVVAGLAASADSVVVDGLVFEKGRADDAGVLTYNGSAISSSQAAGMLLVNNANGGKLAVRNCSFVSNYAQLDGAGLFNNASSPFIANSRFQGNVSVASTAGGGGMVNYDASPVVVNCLFSGNKAWTGGGAYNLISNASFINCTFSGNQVSNGGGAMANSNSGTVQIKNSVLWGNTTPGVTNVSSAGYAASYSLIEGVVNTSNGNLNGSLTTNNPLFVAPQLPASAPTVTGNYSIQVCSPLVDAGDNTILPAGISRDINDQPRTYQASVDIGAAELQTVKNVLYVNANAVVSGDGGSWGSPLKYLSDALSCPNVNTIYAAAGTYYPTGLQTGSDRDAAFLITRGNLKIYGGYNATTGIRDVNANATIMSGAINTASDNDNSYHTLVIAGIGSGSDSIVIDGFIIQNARGDGGTTTVSYNGVAIPRNYGGGVTIYNSVNGGRIVIRNCRSSQNYADYGAGIMSSSSAYALINSQLSGNTAAQQGGGAYIYVPTSTVVPNVSLIGCAITGNISSDVGGALKNNANLDLINCTVSGNRSYYNSGYDVYSTDRTLTIKNTIIWGNSGVGNTSQIITSGATGYNSIIQGLSSSNNSITNNPANNNLDGTLSVNDPLFSSPQSFNAAPTILGDYRLQLCSPVFGKGNNAYMPAGITTDKYNNARIYDVNIDMGAYEDNTPLLAVNTSQTNVSCYGGNNGAATVSVTAPGTYTYSWSPGGGTNATVSGLTTGQYNCKISEGGSCKIVKSFTITQPTVITATVAICNTSTSSATATISPTGGTPPYTYSWSPAGGTNATASGLSPGNYTCTITDNKGCQLAKQVTITSANPLVAGITPTNVSCPGANNGSITVAATGGLAPYSYTWSPGGATTATISGLSPGNYSCTVRDNNGCQTTVNTSISQPGTTIYVNAAAPLNGNGYSWATAYNYLSDAINKADLCSNISTIYVAGGTYYPTGPQNGTDRNASFFIKRGVKVYGGYNSSTGLRDITANPTVLSGAINGTGDNDNSFHVLGILGIGSGADSVVVDGFTIEKGYADVNGNNIVNGVSFYNTYGGGIVLSGNSSNKIAIRNCKLFNNTASTSGGGIYLENSAALIQNCSLAGNSGALSASGSAFTLLNCSISGNSGTYIADGTILNRSYSSVNIINCTIAGNAGRGIYNDFNTSCSVFNSVIYDNGVNGIYTDGSSTTLIKNSMIKGAAGGSNGNLNGITAGPGFVNAISAATTPNTLGDYRLMSCSPLINMGDNTLLPAAGNTDLDNNARLYNTTVDIGAYEIQTAGTVDTVLYVDSSASVSGTGTSWNTALKTLKEALAKAQSCQGFKRICVAKGTYYPAGMQSDTNRNTAFAILRGDLKLYGGYNATTGIRDLNANPTVLSGAINTGSSNDNSYHVVLIAALSTSYDSVVIDGFIIKNGWADGAGTQSYNNYDISRNRGGGLVIYYNQNANKIGIRNSTISDNYASSHGGGIYNYYTSPAIVNCKLTGNTTAANGGGMYNYYTANPKIINCVFSGNIAAGLGGGLFSSESQNNMEVINCGFYGNNAPNGGGVVIDNSTSFIRNSVIWGNNTGLYNQSSTITINNSLIQGLNSTANGNLDGTLTANDPRFNNPSSFSAAPTNAGDYKVEACSPLINKGNNASLPSGVTTDIDGNPRIYNSVTADIGPFEMLAAPAFNVIYVDSAIAVSGTGGTWNTAFKTLPEALNATPCSSHIIYMAKGTYYPTGAQSGTDRRATLAIKRGNIKIYGGYNSTTGLRNIASNATILSGNIGNTASDADNSYHVLSITGISNTTDSIVIDGLKIRDGYADGLGTYAINGVTVTEIEGAGAMLQDNHDNPRIAFRNCEFSNNRATLWGACMANVYGSSPQLYNCRFLNNASGQINGGGGIYNNSSAPTLLNCVFDGNAGGSVFNFNYSHSNITNCLLINSPADYAFINNNSSPGISNCTITGNNGGVTNVNSSSPVINNTIIWGNTNGINGGSALITYSDVQGGFAGTGNINSNPNFINAADANGADNIYGTSDDGLKPAPTSPAVNAGSNALIPAGITSDITGESRTMNITVDMGAYEQNVCVPVIYVDGSVTTSGTGFSWNSPYKTLSDALTFSNACASVNTIYVAAGTYYPTGLQTGTNRSAAFSISRGNLKIYGGYNATTGLRDITSNPTVLSGAINTSSDNDNSYHVLIVSGLQAGADSLVIDGFTIEKARADAAGTSNYNGFNISNSQAAGACLFDNANGNKIALRNCSFLQNYSNLDAGGLYNYRSSPVITNSRFAGNTAGAGGNGGGGAVVNYESSPIVINCLFSGNKAYSGGAVYSLYSTPGFINCTFTANHATNTPDGAILNSHYSNMTLKNTIIWDNSSSINNFNFGSYTAYNSLIQGVNNTANGNMNGTLVENGPLFVNPQPFTAAPTLAGNYQLQTCSPVLNKGNNAALPASIITDLSNNSRIRNTTVDMGAYERPFNSWTGAISSDWSLGGNWSDNIAPVTGDKVFIPATGVVNEPVLNTAASLCGLELEAGRTLGIAGNNTLGITGHLINNGTITGTGRVLMNGTSKQRIAGTGIVQYLEVSNNNDVMIDTGGMQYLTGVLSLSAGNLLTNGKLTLRSTAAGTARVATVEAGAGITGDVTVERYVGIPAARRAWRLITAPLKGLNGLISDNWQSNFGASSGIGTNITGPSGTIGGDFTSGDYSMKTYNPGTQQLDGVVRVDTTRLFTDQSSAANLSYFLFIRGDKTIQSTGATTTILKARGQLQTGMQTFSRSLNAGQFWLIGNPYASPVNFNLVNRSANLPKRFWIWDPNLNTYGGYVLADDVDNNGIYTYSPSIGSSQNNHLQSGQAFFVQASATGSESITFEESHKSTGTVNNVFKTTTGDEELNATLYIVNPDNSLSVADGFSLLRNASYSDSVDFMDAMKLPNINENISIVSGTTNLSIERKSPVAGSDDTVQLKFTNTRLQNYRFSISTSNYTSAQQIYLIDDHENTATPIPVSGSADYSFSVTSATGSWNANRFRLAFLSGATLQVSELELSGTTEGSTAELSWKALNEQNVQHYQLERSTDGSRFSPIHSQAAGRNDNTDVVYKYEDKDMLDGVNYYRVKSTGKDNIIVYSKIIQLANKRRGGESISLYPNPVDGDHIYLSLNNMAPGHYHVAIYDKLGQVVQKLGLQHTKDKGTHLLQLNSSLTAGTYVISVTKADTVNIHYMEQFIIR